MLENCDKSPYAVISRVSTAMKTFFLLVKLFWKYYKACQENSSIGVFLKGDGGATWADLTCYDIGQNNPCTGSSLFFNLVVRSEYQTLNLFA